MATPFVPYREFDATDVVEFIHLLKSHNIDFESEDLGGTRTKIKIQENDLTKVDALIHVAAANLLDTVDKDYHLLKLSNQELMEIVAQPDKWSAFDYQVAKNILGSRKTHRERERNSVWLVITIAALIGFIITLVFAWKN